MKEAQVQNNEFNAQDLCSAIQKRKILIVGIFFLSMIATAIVSIFQEPIFKGDAILIIPSIQYVLNNNGISREASLNAREIVDIIGVIDQEKKKRILDKNIRNIVIEFLDSYLARVIRVAVIDDCRSLAIAVD